ncbi:hypothetical protein [Mesorhizobium sp. SP-1A]|uniref:hypothetical protein n=1 Tax=Mesorhizobium sp. SP-1A TaxID=3077840 RepID=UPI0028F744F4|nr:hypothetical protein [Mesorhizobium sp. SP-1A]
MRIVALGILGFGILGLGLTAVSASAGSIITPETKQAPSAPSVVVLGANTSAPLAARPSPVATPSLIVLGDAPPEVADEKVAAIPRRSGPTFSPMVIRGGIVGSAFAQATAPAQPAEKASGSEPKTLRDAVTQAAGKAPALPTPLY